ncbi:MAG: SulP family inorganic anion transporter [Verrucomicrobia bacterium]|nr:SulP family inorganic anion transporter [Verrucomicrobiota bacterium]
MKLLREIRRMTADLRGHLLFTRLDWFPFVGVLRHYDARKLRRDSRAALDVTLLAVPQSMALAAIAGLPVVQGMVCTAVAAMVAPLFCASRHTILGPTNATAFMLFSFFSATPLLAARATDLVPLLVLMIGVFTVAGALLRMADLMQYVSRSVMVGYLSGAAVLIIANQAAHLLGIANTLPEGSAASFPGLVLAVVSALPDAHIASIGIGLVTLGLHACITRWHPHWPAFAITLVLASAVMGPFVRAKVAPFEGVAVFDGFAIADLAPRVPDVFRADVFNDISVLLGVAFAIAFLATLENSLMARTFASRTGDRPQVNQDMLATGMANVAVAFAGGMPASGSLTRSTLNFESGALTRFASFFSGMYGLLLVVAVAALGDWDLPVVGYVPVPVLAALVIAIALPLFNLRNLRICLRTTGDDALVMLATFAATLIAPLHVAIFIGVAVSVGLFMRKASRPELVEYEFSEQGELREKEGSRSRPIPAVSIVHVEGDLFFGAADLFRSQVQRTVADPAIRVIILRLRNARNLDATSVMALEDLIRHLRERSLHLIVSGATREVYKVLKRSGVLETLQDGCDRREGESNLFMTSARNPNLSTRAALLRAQQLLGTHEADVRIFHDATQTPDAS